MKSTTQQESMQLKVLTYNMHKGFSTGNIRFVLHQIREALESSDVDLVFLQEIQGEHHRRQRRINNWPTGTQFEFLADRLWPHFAYGKNAIYDAGHHGNAILSKYPFVSWENINLSSYQRASRSLLHGIIRIPGVNRNIHVICIHLALLASERQRQLSVLRHRIETHIPYDAPLILGGDFNDWLGQAERGMKMHLGLHDVFKQLTGRRARTYPIWLPVLPVDRIYFRGMDPEKCECLSSAPWRRLSDHAALHATFNLLENEGSRNAEDVHTLR